MHPSLISCFASKNRYNYTNANSLVNIVVYKGTGIQQAITGVGFQPDLVMIRPINVATASGLWYFIDSTRGGTKTFNLSSTAATEATDANAIQSFDVGGFTMGTSATFNTNKVLYQCICIKKDSAFFDIVSYVGNITNRTVAHGLNGAPGMMWIKNRGSAQLVAVYHNGNGATPAAGYLRLNNVTANTADATVFNSTAPTASNFAVGTSVITNGNTNNMIAYLFKDTAWFKIFSYIGNGLSYNLQNLGFCPYYVAYKNIGASTNWAPITRAQMPSESKASNDYTSPSAYPLNNTSNPSTTMSAAGSRADITSKGFALRSSVSTANQNGSSYVGFAFQTYSSHGIMIDGVTNTNTFRVPTSVSTLLGMATWGNGGDGAATAAGAGGGGGGGGGYSERLTVPVTSRQAFKFSGTSATDVNFAGMTITTAGNASGTSGGGGGIATGGDTNVNGATGGNAAGASGGAGGAAADSSSFLVLAGVTSFTGAGGAGGANQGSSGVIPGGGGGGDGTGGSGSGGNGQEAYMAVWW